MKNSDMPAMPLTGEAYQDFAGYDGTRRTSYNPECQGLTKREYFAALALNGLMSDPRAAIESLPHGRELAEWVAEQALYASDALLEKLDSTQP